MTIIDTISKGIRDADKKGKLVRRKRRQKAKQKIAKEQGDMAEVKRLGKKKKMTTKKRKKAQKEINKISVDLAKRAGKAGVAGAVVASKSGFTPVAALASGLAFVA